MIFVTVGEQLPFDRLIRAVDECALSVGVEIFAQIGETDLRPENIKYKKFLDPGVFKEKFLAADLVVGHAGMGTIITALDLGKSLLVLPRISDLGEARNNHQLATAKKFLELNYISVAFNEEELSRKINKLSKVEKNHGKVIRPDPAPLLIKTIRDFVFD